MLNLNFTPFPELITERLKLRKLSPEDFNDIFMIRTNEKINQFINRPKSSPEDAAKFIEKITNSIDNNETILWGITLKDENRLIGTICLWNIDPAKVKAELGYELLPDFHGKGYMQEAFSEVIRYGFSTIQLSYIEAYTHKKNEASLAILEKNGFKRDLWAEGKANDLPLHMVIYTRFQTDNSELN